MVLGGSKRDQGVSWTQQTIKGTGLGLLYPLVNDCGCWRATGGAEHRE